MRVAVILGALGPMAGCLFDPTVPIDATLACATDADCPADAVCVVGRCSPVEALRTPAPVVTDVAISPSLVGRGGRVEVSFTIDGALQAAPIVEGDVGRPVRLDPIAGGDGRFRFSYTVDGTESPGEAGLTAFLVDALGRSTTATLGSFSLDLQAPTLAEPTLARGSVGRGSAIIVEAVLDEPAPAVPAAKPYSLVPEGGSAPALKPKWEPPPAATGAPTAFRLVTGARQSETQRGSGGRDSETAERSALADG